MKQNTLKKLYETYLDPVMIENVTHYEQNAYKQKVGKEV